MLLPSANVLVHTVTLTINQWGQDRDGMRVIIGSSTVPGVRCQVDPGDPVREVQSHEGLERVTTYIPHELLFVTDYGLKVDDEIDWNDGVRPHHMIVAGVAPQAGRAPLLVKANERV